MQENMKEQIRETIESLDDWDLVELHNEYCRANNYYDDEIFDMAVIDDLLCDMKPSKVLNLAFYGDFNPNHEYFKFNGYGNLESLDYLSDYIDIDDITKYVVENEDSLGCQALAEKLEELSEDEEEDDESAV